jgi:hypothetical protein
MIVAAYFWQIEKKRIPFAISRMALNRRVVRNFPGVSFAKLLGCGTGERFTPSDADPLRWGILVAIDENQIEAFDNSDFISEWRKNSHSEFRALLSPISSHGQWSKREPFSVLTKSSDGAIVAITRARISFLGNFRFWRAVPPVTTSLHNSPGLISAIGIGEAPIGLQGTFSLWESAQALRDFAYKGEAHTQVIADTKKYQWYSEELFARFAVLELRGTL